LRAESTLLARGAVALDGLGNRTGYHSSRIAGQFGPGGTASRVDGNPLQNGARGGQAAVGDILPGFAGIPLACSEPWISRASDGRARSSTGHPDVPECQGATERHFA